MPRKPIMIGQKHLHEATLEEIFDHVFMPLRSVFDLGRMGDYRRNCDLLELFGDDEVLDARTIVDRYKAMDDREYSEQFDTLRGAELMRWADNNKLVERVDDVLPLVRKWRLLYRTRAYETFGRSGKPSWSVRVRHIDDPVEAGLAAKAWVKEQKRAARLLAKRVAQEKVTAMRCWTRSSVSTPIALFPKSSPISPLPA